MKITVAISAHQTFATFATQTCNRIECGDVPEWLREMFLSGDPPWIATILSDYGLPISAKPVLLSFPWAFHACLSASNPTPGALSPRELREHQERFIEFDEFLAKLSTIGIGVEIFEAPGGLGGEPTFVAQDVAARMREDLLPMLRQLSELPLRNGRPPEYRGSAFIELDRALNAIGFNFVVPQLTKLGTDLFDGILESHFGDGIKDLPRARDLARAAKIKNGTLRKTPSE